MLGGCAGYLGVPTILAALVDAGFCGTEGRDGAAEPAEVPHSPGRVPVPARRWRQQLLVLTKASSRGNRQPRNGSSAARRGASPHEGVSGTRSGDTARSGRPPPFAVTVSPASSPGDSGGARHGALGTTKIPMPQFWQPCRVQSLSTGCRAVPTVPGVLSPGGDNRDPQAPRGVCLQSPPPSAFQDKSPSR